MVALTGVGDAQYAIASVTFIEPLTVQVGAASQTLLITGSNFYPASVVNVKGVAQPTTFISNSQLSATLNAAAVAQIGEEPLTVVNPAPGGGTSNAGTLTPYQALAIGASSLTYVPTTGKLYVTIPASSLSNPNTIVPIDPNTGATGSPVPVGNDPRMIAASGDGKYLYVLLLADQTIQRVNLLTSAVERTFAYPTVSWITPQSLTASDIHVVPGVNQSVVVSIQRCGSPLQRHWPC